MKTSSKKGKGRRLQNFVRDRLVTSFPSLEDDDIKVAIMGENGEDIKLSPAAKKAIPYSFECMYASRPITSTDLLNKMEQAKRQNNDLALAIKTTPAVILEIEGYEPFVMFPLNDYCENSIAVNIPNNKEQVDEIH